MNSVLLIGRLTKDPEVRESVNNACCRFNLAISKGKDKNGTEMVDYPSVVCFGKTADNCRKYLSKGSQVGVIGSIHTGSYEKDGKKVYTTDVLAERVEFLSKQDKAEKGEQIEGFTKLEDDLPF